MNNIVQFCSLPRNVAHYDQWLTSEVASVTGLMYIDLKHRTVCNIFSSCIFSHT
jgi:hypothetical protein